MDQNIACFNTDCAGDRICILLVVPPVRLSSVANRAFRIVGPRIWNDLPADVTSGESLSSASAENHLFSKKNHFLAVWLFSVHPPYLTVSSGLNSRPSLYYLRYF